MWAPSWNWIRGGPCRRTTSMPRQYTPREWPVPSAFIAASFGVFAYFYPILAGVRLPPEAFRRWMWFPTWI